MEENSVSIVVGGSGIVVESEETSIIKGISESGGSWVSEGSGASANSGNRNWLFDDELLETHGGYCEEVLGSDCGENS